MANLSTDNFDDELIFDAAEVEEIANQIKAQKLERTKSTKPKSEKRQRHIVVSVRLTPEEYEKISVLAKDAKSKIGTYLRDSTLNTSTFNSIEIVSESISTYPSTFTARWSENNVSDENNKEAGSSDYKSLFDPSGLLSKSA